MTISCIAACASGNVIGNNGCIPWTITGEQKRFKELTVNHVVIMGRRTYEEIAAKLGGPLPHRTTIVLSTFYDSATTTGCYESSELYFARTVNQALELASGLIKSPSEEIFIAGGESVYKAFLPHAHYLYLTEIDAEIPGDTFFPQIDTAQWSRTVISEHEAEFRYRYVTWKRMYNS